MARRLGLAGVSVEPSNAQSVVQLVGGRPAPAKSLLEPRVVAYGGEVLVSARVVAKPRKELDGPPEVGKCVVAGVARERREARVVVMQACVVRHALEGTTDRLERASA